jgi:hypothetical protein
MRYLALAILSTAAAADPAEIVSVDASPRANGWQFHVTLRHADTGLDDYADGWRVELPDGTVLGTRDLLHPHVNEQPFTRSLSGVVIPGEAQEVAIRARTNRTGWARDSVRFLLD